jgi:hypothetical protein
MYEQNDEQSAFGSRLFVGVEKPQLPYLFLSDNFEYFTIEIHRKSTNNALES